MSCCIFFFYVLRPVEKRKREKKRCVYACGERYGVVLPCCVLMLHHASLFFSLFALSTPRWPHPSVIFDRPFLPSQRPCWFTDRLHNMQWAGNSYACGCTLICSLGGRLQGCTHAQQHASFVKIPKPSRHAVVSSSFFSHGFNFWRFQTSACATLTNRAEQMQRCWPDSATDWGQKESESSSACLSLCLRLLCSHS